MKFIKIFIPIFISFVLIFTVLSPSIKASESINQKILRLHIIANSDSTDDQNLKLKVRDYILENTKDVFTGDTLEENLAIAKANESVLTNLSNECLAKNNSSLKAKVTVTNEFFNTRVYDDFILPAGNYNSIKITIGEGMGHNWWCIIFPSVCLSSCSESMDDYLEDEEMQLITSDYTAKFKVIEIYEKIKSKIINE